MAGRFPDAFLDDVRRALPVSAVVGRRVALKKAGAEFKGLSPFNKESSPSFTVNDQKAFWHDFSSGKHGDIFGFEMEVTGCTFVAAVETLAQMAGISLPDAGRRPSAQARQGGPEAPPQDDVPPPEHPDEGHAQPQQSRGRSNITRTYAYNDADGVLSYQVCRLEWHDKGKRKKTFLQRRPVPGESGHWAWGLAGGDYLRGRNGDFYQATEDRLAEWVGAEKRYFDETPHGLYRFVELREEMAVPEDERRAIWVPEGEKDADTLADWGCVATTNSAGAKHWLPHHAEELRGADVIVPVDNDKAGRERGHMIAASLRGVAARVRVLDWREAWPQAPEKGDVTDWRDHANGTAAKLWAIADKLPDWVPVPPESSFNGVRFVDLDKPARELEWLIKKVLTRGELSIWFGPPGCGKSFLLTDAALAIARGMSWMGQRVRQGLVIYQAGEGGLGLKKRLRAYRRHHNMRHDENVPFVLLPQPINLYASDADVDKLIAEIKAWAAYYDAPLELIVIDTFSAASPGADENASKDVTPIMSRCRRIVQATGAHVALVHHTPKAGGSPRGWSGLTGNIENSVEVIRTEHTDEELVGDHRVRRDIREFVVRKQKDDEDGYGRSFVLKQVVLGRDPDDDLITSCVVHELNVAAAQPANTVPVGYTSLKPNNLTIFRALVTTLKEKGTRPADGVQAPEWTSCVRIGDWQDTLAERSRGHEEINDKLRARVKKAIQRACDQWGSDGIKLIGKDKEWIWRTDRKVNQVDPPPARPQPRVATTEPDQPDMLTAPGENPDDMRLDP